MVEGSATRPSSPTIDVIEQQHRDPLTNLRCVAFEKKVDQKYT